LIDDTEVDEEQVVRIDDGSVREMVDFPAVWSGGDNGLKRITVDVVVGGHFGEDQSLNRSLSHARTDCREDGVEDLLVDLLGFMKEGDFGGGFDLPDLLDHNGRMDLMERELVSPFQERMVADCRVDSQSKRAIAKPFLNSGQSVDFDGDFKG